MDLHLVSGARSVSGFDGAAVDENVPFFDETLNGAAGNGGEPVAKPGIQPF
jgi:hypothetical protein